MAAQYEHKVMLKVKTNAADVARSGFYSISASDSGSVYSQQAAATTQSNPSLLNDDPEDSDFDEKKSVVFHATPQIQETGSASWNEIDSGRAPASILTYAGSPSRNFNISAKFISRTQKEANLTLRYVNLLRSWRLPYMTEAADRIQAEPEVLNLFGYGHMFRAIPVIMRSLNIDLNDDVDYIKASNGTDVPIIWPVSMTLQEIHTISDFDKFNLDEFKKGILPWW